MQEELKTLGLTQDLLDRPQGEGDRPGCNWWKGSTKMGVLGPETVKVELDEE